MLEKVRVGKAQVPASMRNSMTTSSVKCSESPPSLLLPCLVRCSFQSLQWCLTAP